MPSVVLTGASGFLGRHLSAALRQQGIDVIAPLRDAAATPSTGGSGWGRLVAVDAAPEGLTRSVLPWLNGQAPEAIVHAATCYGRHDEPDAALQRANVELPTAALALAQLSGARGFVNVDTVLAADASRYAASKARFRSQLEAWAGNADMPVVNLRMEHLYGPGDAADRFVPWLAERCRAGATAVALGRGDREREFVHIDDAVEACLSLLPRLCSLLPGWHDTRARGECTTIRRLAESVRALTGGSATALHFGARAERPVETDDALPDDSLLRAGGWQRRIALADGLRTTLQESAR